MKHSPRFRTLLRPSRWWQKGWPWLTAGVVVGLGVWLVWQKLLRPNFWHWVEENTAEEVIYFVPLPPEKKLIALTIDDGPHPEVTPLILATLREYDVRATFFVVGDHVPGNEALLTQMVAEGHELGNHLLRIEPSINKTPAEFEAELVATDKLLRQFTPQVRWFRPGSGWYNQTMLNSLRQYGYTAVLGSIYPYDAQIIGSDFANDLATDFIVDYILRRAQPGRIIILHDGFAERLQVVEVLRRILPELQARGFHIVTVNELTMNNEQ
jgi:peptidoglycan-N-acetylglucosamine deacetylase